MAGDGWAHGEAQPIPWPVRIGECSVVLGGGTKEREKKRREKKSLNSRIGRGPTKNSPTSRGGTIPVPSFMLTTHDHLSSSVYVPPVPSVLQLVWDGQ